MPQPLESQLDHLRRRYDQDRPAPQAFRRRVLHDIRHRTAVGTVPREGWEDLLLSPRLALAAVAVAAGIGIGIATLRTATASPDAHTAAALLDLDVFGAHARGMPGEAILAGASR